MVETRKVAINNKSVGKASNIKDVKIAISQYIWNSFDANTSEVNIDYSINQLKGIDKITIIDNGSGIDYFNLENTFGLLLDSQKKTVAGSTIRGGKGSGRFAFNVFASKAIWTSVFKKGSDLYKYTITIEANDKDNYELSPLNKVDNKKNKVGCSVAFYNIEPEKSGILSTLIFIDFLKREFGWYLHLNKSKKITLKLNNTPIDYNSIIYDSEDTEIRINTNSSPVTFKINYIEWKTDIGDKFYYNYFLDENHIEKGKNPTSFNKNGIGFHHSVYVVSDYFNTYTPACDLETNNEFLFEGDGIFKELKDELHKYLFKKQKKFIERNAESLIEKLEEEKVFPEFGKSSYEIERRNEFVILTKSVFKLQPRLFIKVAPLQKKSFLGLLKLVIDSDERENIIKIIEAVVNDLNKEERAELAQLLGITKINKLVRTVKGIVTRMKDIEILKTLVYQLEKYTTERDHIQKIMEECFWLFGEQFSLITADKKFEDLLNGYYIGIQNKSLTTDLKLKINHIDKNRRPDLFLCRKRPLTTSNSTLLEENIIIELKRPSVTIGMTQFRQIQDYMNLIIHTPEFNGDTRIWKFYLVGIDTTEEINMRLRKNQEDGKESFLIEDIGKYKIYVIKWDDLFQSFRLKNNFLLENLDIDNNALLLELNSNNIPKSELPEFLIKKINKL